MITDQNLRVGPAGWSYKDWYGNVYPEKPGKNFKELNYLARFFNTAEVNSTFYKPVNPFAATAWVKKVAHNPNFKFTAKLWQRFSHQREPYTEAEIALVRQGLDPLMQSDKLGAVLIQFPWSFRDTEENREWLHKVTETFRDYPLVIEIRHASWENDSFYNLLKRMQIGIASIDQPVIGQSIVLKPVSTGNIGYVRMHGRNYENWFAKKNNKQPAFARYDYLYSEEEIKVLAQTVRTVAAETKETYVIQNNHPRGQAIVNAAQIQADLTGAILQLPESLITAYPQLNRIARPDSSQNDYESPDLFIR